MKPNDGGPAFPEVEFDNGHPQYTLPGATLRAYIATAALKGILASGTEGGVCPLQDPTQPFGAQVASHARAYADALLVELNKPAREEASP